MVVSSGFVRGIATTPLVDLDTWNDATRLDDVDKGLTLVLRIKLSIVVHECLFEGDDA